MGLQKTNAKRDFLRVVEVFPPNYVLDRSKEPLIGLKQKMRDFVERVKRIQNLADAILIADVKDPSRLKVPTIYSAAVLQEELGIEAIPVITARDSNRTAIRSAILAALSYDLTSLMLVWGDRYSKEDGSKNVYDYKTLGEVLEEARLLSERAGNRLALFAPVDLTKLDGPRGLRLARARLRSGADYLLAQPPTVDTSSTLPLHSRTLRKSRLASTVLLNVFPFRDKKDIESCRRRFGWRLPDHLGKIAEGGESELLKEARRVAERLEAGGSPGVYVSTRGRPELARFILD